MRVITQPQLTFIIETMEEFKTISVIGRMAFGIHCLQQALASQGYDQHDPSLQLVIERFGKFVESPDLGNWHQEATEVAPLAILDPHPVYDDEWLTLTSQQVQALRALYKAMPNDLTYLINSVFRIGEADLYGSTGIYSESSYKEVNDVIAVMKKLNLPLPDVKAYRISPFTEFNGWGNTRPLSDFE